jgi:arsenate reductase
MRAMTVLGWLLKRALTMPRPEITIYHNPNCGTSRNVLAWLREQGHEPKVVEYLKTPLSKTALSALVKEMKVPVKDVVRAKEKVFDELKLEGASDAKLLAAMAEHPILMNRPIVVVKRGANVAAKLCRPKELVEELVG